MTALRPPGGTRWRRVEHHAEVDSTNRLLAARAAAGEPPGLVVVADHQTAGRGRLDRGWEDRPGDSLLCSALVDADGLAATLIPLAAGLAVVDAARDAGAEARLKWPNDVLVAVGSPPRRQKCAGILVEGVHHAGHARAVVGVGVNVDWRSAPGTPRASLAASVGRAVDRFAVLDRLLVHLDRRVAQLRDDPDGSRDDYRAVCTTLGREVRADTPEGMVTGTAVDVDEGGALRLRTPQGEVVLHAGDVTHLRPVDDPG